MAAAAVIILMASAKSKACDGCSTGLTESQSEFLLILAGVCVVMILGIAIWNRWRW